MDNVRKALTELKLLKNIELNHCLTFVFVLSEQWSKSQSLDYNVSIRKWSKLSHTRPFIFRFCEFSVGNDTSNYQSNIKELTHFLSVEEVIGGQTPDRSLEGL